MLYTLTKREIAEAITAYIGTHKKNQSFFPYRISASSLQVSETEDFQLTFIPKGTFIKDVIDFEEQL